MGHSEMRLQIQPVANAPEARPMVALANLVRIYEQQIDDRKVQLQHDLAYYQAKLGELDKIDPLDFTGLKRIYSSHVERTRGLLASLAE